MRYSAIAIQPRWLRAEDAGRYVRLPGLLTRFVKAAWLRPVVRQKKMTLFRRADVDQCLDRVEQGEFPPEDQDT